MGRYDARATVHWQGFGGSVASASGLLSTATAAQVELGGPGGATNPEELFAAAHANCFTSTITSMARSRGIDLAHVVTEARVRLEWSDDAGDHRLAASDLAVRLSSTAHEDDLRALVDDATEHCPVCQAIRGNVAMQVTASFDAPRD
jgi:lipoyl-dependent peroxiredoxin